MPFDMAEWVESNLDKARPSAGSEWTAECPWCGRYGGFYVNVDPEGRGPFVCFKCNTRSKSIVDLVAYVEDIEPHEARALIARSTIEFRRKETTTSLLERVHALRTVVDLDSLDLLREETSTELPQEFIPVWDGKRWRVPVYMTERGFTREVQARWGVGFCERGRYQQRVIIPMRCPNGRSFTARDVTGEQEPKYLNPKGIDHRRLVFGWDLVPMTSDFTMVEGPLDTMKLDQHGIPAFGVGGKVLHMEQLNMLFTRPANVEVTVMLDPEAALEAMNVAAQLVVHFTNVRLAQLPDGVDPGASTRRIAHFTHAKAKPFRGERGPRVIEAVKRSRDKLQKRY